MRLLLEHPPGDSMGAVIGYIANMCADKTDDEVVEVVDKLGEEIGNAVLKVRKIRESPIVIPGGSLAH